MAHFVDEDLINEWMPHFIYCGNYYGNNLESDRVENFKKLILKKMKKFEIESSMLTMLDMWRLKLVTEEKAEEAWDGMLEDDAEWGEMSINDDLEILRTNILNSSEIEVGC